MGRVSKRKTKNLESVPTQFLSSTKKKRKSKTNITPTKRNKRTKHVHVNNKLNENVHFSTEEIDTEDDSFPLHDKLKNMDTDNSKVVIPNNTSIEIIDITNTTIYDSKYVNSQTIPSEKKNFNFANDEIVDLTNITIISNNVNEHINSQPSSSVSKHMHGIDDESDDDESDDDESDDDESDDDESDDDVQIIDQPTPILITISDDSDNDDENQPNLKPIAKPIGLKSIKERLGISNHSKSIVKKKYNSPLRNHRKQVEAKTLSSDDHLPINLGAFIIDKQRITNHTKNFNSHSFKSFVKVSSFPQQQKPSSDPIANVARRLRPIAIDGLNIGHAYGSGIFSVKGIELCIQFFADRGHKDILAFLPQHRQGPPGSESNTILNELVKKGHICYTPSRKVQHLRMTCYDDRIILNHAHRYGGVVVSNDNFRDLYEESDAFKEIIENRHIMVTFARGEIIVPEDQYNRKSDIRSLSDILCFPEKI